MTRYKSRSVIPAGRTPPAETKPDSGDCTAPDDGTGAPPAGDTGVPASTPPGTRWQNDRWAVTDFGLESLTTAGDPPQLVPYRIEKERLLAASAGVSDWALQLAGKIWMTDPIGLLDAIEAALRIHHPGQKIVDFAATREAMLDEWARTRGHPGDEWEYVPGEATLCRIARQQAAARVAAATCADASHGLATGVVADDDVDPAWLAAYPPEHRALLQEHGMPPDVDRRAGEYNDRLIGLAKDNLEADQFLEAVEDLRDDLLGDGPPEDDEFDPPDWQ